MRNFADLRPDLHEKLPWPVCRCSNRLSLAFARENFNPVHKSAIRVAWEEGPDPASSESPSNPDDFRGTPAYLVITGAILSLEVSSPVFGDSWQTLRSLYVPDSVEEIRDKCFYKIATLSHVRFGESSSLKRIGSAAFWGCPLEYIHLPNTVEHLDDACFCKCEHLLHVTFGETSSLKRIGWKAFFSCPLTHLHFPASLEELHDKCCCRCGSLSRVTFEEPSSLKYIGIKAFAKCSLKEILIPDSLEELCDMCFYNCASFSRITFGPNSSLKSIGCDCFLGCSVVNFSLPHGVLSIGGILMMNGGFDYIFRLSEHCLVANDGRLCYLWPDLSHRLPHPTVEYLCGSARAKRRPADFHTRWPSVKVIGRGAFAGQMLGHSRLPGRFEEIGEMSFWKCYGLPREITFRESALKRVGSFAFSESGVEKVEIPKRLKEIERGCFCCTHVHQLTFQEPSSLKVIGPLAFFGCRLVNVTIPDSVEEIGDKCFARCRYLSVSFGESSSLKRIGVKAFSKSGVHDITIPDSVEEIGDECFYMCTCLSSIDFGESSSLRRIGVRAFSRSGLRGIKIPGSVEEIGDECFYMCGSLSAVAFGDASSLTIVGADAFGHCQLPMVPLPGGVTAREPVSKPRVVKIAIMGPRDSGKTSVIKAYTDAKWTFDPDPVRREALDHVYSVQETFGGETYELQIVEVDLPSKRPLLYSDGIIDDIDVVISVNRADKLVGRHALTFDSGELYPWAPELRVVSAVDLVKPYMRSSFDVGRVRKYVQCSAKTGENIREVFLKAIELHVKDLETNTPHATQTRFVTPDFTSLC